MQYTVYPKGSVLKLHIRVLQSVYLQSNSSLSGSELNSQKVVGVVVGFTCSKHSPGACLYGFAQLKQVSNWGFRILILVTVLFKLFTSDMTVHSVLQL